MMLSSGFSSIARVITTRASSSFPRSRSTDARFPRDAGSSGAIVSACRAVDSASSRRPRDARAHVRSFQAERNAGCSTVTARNARSATSQRPTRRAPMP